MTTKKTLRLLKKMGDLVQQLTNIKEALGKSEFFEDLLSWDVVNIYYNCKIENGFILVPVESFGYLASGQNYRIIETGDEIKVAGKRSGDGSGKKTIYMAHCGCAISIPKFDKLSTAKSCNLCSVAFQNIIICYRSSKNNRFSVKTFSIVARQLEFIPNPTIIIFHCCIPLL